MAEAPQIDWSTASVVDGTLSVELTVAAPRGWSGRFKLVARVLDQAAGRWGAAAVARSVITVRSVTPGSEPDLRHFLEGVVLQVNADLALEPREGDAGSSLQRRRAADNAMAAAFRAFAADAG